MSVIYMDRDSFNTLNESDIRRIYQENEINNMKYKKLYDYYIGKHDILKRVKKNNNDPNNHIVNNMCKYVTDSITGYSFGEPVVYTSQNDQYLEKIQNIFDFNDEQDENTEVAKFGSIHGDCFELEYMDENANIRFAKVPADQGVLIKDAAQEDGYLGFIRAIHSQDKRKNKILKIEFYTATDVWYFRSESGASLELVNIIEHYWNDVPVVEFQNNAERIGDYEGIISIVDAYNKVQSNTANLFQYNDEALMKITKMGDVTTDDVRDMRQKGAIILEDGGDVNWMTKEINDTALENYKNRLVTDMHLFSGVPNMSDGSFGGNLSGVAISYKMWSMDQIVKVKQRKFKRALQRRIELITNILNLFGANYDYRDIDIKFKRNMPQNKLENAQIVQMLSSMISQETALGMIDGIENVNDEMEKIENENADPEVKNGVYKNLANAFSLEGIENEQEAETATA